MTWTAINLEIDRINNLLDVCYDDSDYDYLLTALRELQQQLKEL